MAENYGATVTTRTPDAVLGGGHPPVTVNIVLLADTTSADATCAERGLVLGRVTASGKYTNWDEEAVDGSEDARAVLADRTHASGADAGTVAYVHGEFNRGGLGWGDAASGDIDAEIVKMLDLGLYVKESKSPWRTYCTGGR
jgi:hypothetical protein